MVIGDAAHILDEEREHLFHEAGTGPGDRRREQAVQNSFIKSRKPRSLIG
jgi:hypothetical protein